jgi:putative Holliday junction resolvase
MRYLGLDVGDKTIGIALSDETATIAGAIETMRRVGPRQDLRLIAEKARAHEAEQIVVGLPKRLDGSLGPQAEKVLAFVEGLRRACRIPVVSWDERFSTAHAERALIEGDVSRKNRKEVVDKVAAALILQNYLDALKISEGRPPEP